MAIPAQHHSEMNFLSKEIVEPAITAGARLEMKSVSEDRFDRIQLKNFDVIVMANVGDLSTASAQKIRSFVESADFIQWAAELTLEI